MENVYLWYSNGGFDVGGINDKYCILKRWVKRDVVVIKLDNNLDVYMFGGVVDMKYETNDKFWTDLLGAELISAFTQDTLVRLYFRKDDGTIVRIKVPIDWYEPVFEKKIIEVD